MTTKLAIAIDLDQLRDLMQEFIERTDVGQLNPLTSQLLFSSFLVWLRQQQQETTNGEISQETGGD